MPDRHIRPAGPAGFVRGALLHVGVSVLAGEGLARTVPEGRSVIWSGGAAIGVINRSDWTAVFADCGASARSQLADNVAFGACSRLSSIANANGAGPQPPHGQD